MTTAFEHRLRRVARQTRDRPALSFHDDGAVQRLSYGALCARIDAALANGTVARPGELVFIAAATDAASIVTYLANLFAGAVPAFLSPLTTRQDPALHARELQALCERFQPHILVQNGVAQRLHSRPPAADAPRGGFLQFSSGTTSLRKAVFIPDARLMAQLQALAGALDIGADDRIASWLPLYHDMGLIATLFLPLAHGASVAFLDPVAWSHRPDTLLALVAQERATLCWQPDFAFRHLLLQQRRLGARAPRHDLASLRRWVSCSEPCRADTFAQFQAHFAAHGLRPDALQTCYAMAETVFAISQSRFDGTRPPPSVDGFLSSGQVVDGCTLRITADGDAAAGLGQIEVRSPCLFDQYLGQATPARADGWHRTGDLGCLRDGELFVVGRVDDTLVVHGKKIIAHQIEDHLGSLPGFKPGRVFCTLHADGAGLAVYHEGEPQGDAARAAIRQWVATTSAVSLASLTWLPAGTLVKSSSGKIARRKTLDKLRSLADVAAAVPA